MKTIRTIRLKIISEHKQFDVISLNYLLAANWLSDIVFSKFQNKPIPAATKLQKEFYGTIRNKFQIPSQVTCSLFRHVVGTYKSMRSQQEWIKAIYKKHTLPMGWRRDFSLTKKGLSFWGEPSQYQSAPIPKGRWIDSKLKNIKNQWYLCLCIEIDVPDIKEHGGIIGIDSGQKNIFTAVDLKSNKTLYIKGGILSHKRLRIRQIRSKVASVGTRSAYRLLKRLSGREKAVTQQALHLASKQVVAFADRMNARTVVMENLKGIRKSSRRPESGEKTPVLHNKQRTRNNRWPFAQGQFYVNYKALAKGVESELVSPRNTSRSCPKCGHTDKTNRNGFEFRCKVCNHADHADRVGAMNIAMRLLSLRQAAGKRAECQPAYSSHEAV